MLTNLGIPASVLSPAIHQIAQANESDIRPISSIASCRFMPVNTTLVTIFRGANDTNALAEAIDKGAAGNDLQGNIATQVRAFGADYDRLVRGVRSQAADAFIIVVNVPNMAGLPYASAYSVSRRQVKLQAIAVGFARGPIARLAPAWSCWISSAIRRCATVDVSLPTASTLTTLVTPIWRSGCSRS